MLVGWYNSSVMIRSNYCMRVPLMQVLRIHTFQFGHCSLEGSRLRKGIIHVSKGVILHRLVVLGCVLAPEWGVEAASGTKCCDYGTAAIVRTHYESRLISNRTIYLFSFDL